MSVRVTPAEMEARAVRFADLRPCLNAFIDTRTPGSEAKENFTIIGPGVSENPAQHVHIAEAHGFNIGGARQPPNCVNSQHSHTSAEVFIAHSGRWRFDLGEHGTDAHVHLGPGDTISLPTNMFRGFTNVGDDTGFLWAVLGGDDPGRVTWAPAVFDMARDYGLVLLENGSLVDTAAGEAMPAGVRPMPRTSPEEVARLDVPTQGQADTLVVREADRSAPIIGPAAPLGWPHGFALDRAVVAPGSATAKSAAAAARVWFVHRGDARIEWADGAIALGAGDTLSVPAGVPHRIGSAAGATAFFVDRA